jgi:hypothetical protein
MMAVSTGRGLQLTVVGAVEAGNKNRKRLKQHQFISGLLWLLIVSF